MTNTLSSLWSATATERSPATPLAGEVSADVVVIGAGYTGCSAALDLALRGVDVVVIDAEDVGWGGRSSSSTRSIAIATTRA
jgi:glycine/D-amino acid oxidase-like deaminating enzyme